jgi:hypothetical protein
MKLRQLIVGKIEYLEQQNKRFDNFRVYRFFSIFPLFLNSWFPKYDKQLNCSIVFIIFRKYNFKNKEF